MKTFITNSARETRKLGEILANELKHEPASRRIIALSGELGSGKTTFTQGILKGLDVKGPYTSPTFTIIKQYKPTTNNQRPTTQKKKKLSVVSCKSLVYHIDAYRVISKDILNLGWEEIIREKDSIIIIEWADRVRKIIPRRALWIKFEWAGKNKRKIIF